MPGAYTGDFADAVLIHPLDTEDGDVVGPGAWTLKNAATITPVNARFGSNLNCDTGTKLMDSDSAITGFDGSDGKKVLYHFFWTADNLSFNRTMAGIVDAAQTVTRTRILWDVAGARIIVRWTRKTDLGVGLAHLRVRSTGGLLTLGQTISLVGFIDSGSAAQGKVFIDGVDSTSDVINNADVAALAATLQHARVGNHTNALDPGQFIDHLTMIQNDALSDAKAALLVAQYEDTRGFGYRPTFTSVDFVNVIAGDTVTLTGTGFGKDVAIKVGGIDATNVVRASESSVSFRVPAGMSVGLVDLTITNVESNVTWTETEALNHKTTVWSSNGGSTRRVKFGDGIISGMVKVGDAVPFCDPNVSITDWTKLSRSPD